MYPRLRGRAKLTAGGENRNSLGFRRVWSIRKGKSGGARVGEGIVRRTRIRSGVLSRLVAGLVLLGSLALGVGLGLSAQWDRRAARSAHPRVDGRLTVEGLAAPVVILRDLRGVPHIRARSDADALRGLGFSHAQDRLAQMVWLLRSAQGRAAELIGPSALPSDRIARTVGWWTGC